MRSAFFALAVALIFFGLTHIDDASSPHLVSGIIALVAAALSIITSIAMED